MPSYIGFLKREPEAILKECPPAPTEVPEGRRGPDWDPFPAAEQLDRFYPPLRLLLILDNLAGHYSHDLVRWSYEHGVGLLYTPCAGSWRNLAESVQRIIIRRALAGHHIYDVEILKDWLRDTIEGWNRHPTPSSGEASGTPAAIARMPGARGKEDQARPRRMCCRAVSVRCAITDTSAIPLAMGTGKAEQRTLEEIPVLLDRHTSFPCEYNHR